MSTTAGEQLLCLRVKCPILIILDICFLSVLEDAFFIGTDIWALSVNSHLFWFHSAPFLSHSSQVLWEEQTTKSHCDSEEQFVQVKEEMMFSSYHLSFPFKQVSLDCHVERSSEANFNIMLITTSFRSHSCSRDNAELLISRKQRTYPESIPC